MAQPCPRAGLRQLRCTVPAGLIAALQLLIGCQSYEPQAIDLAAHQVKWRERSASRESLTEFARELGEASYQDSNFNPTDGISLREGRHIALVFNPDLRLARLEAGVARATADFAGLWDDPELSIDVLNITQTVPDPWIISSALAFTIPISGRLKVEKARAEANLHAELERVFESEWEVTRKLTDTWLKWSAEGLKLEETRVIISKLDRIVESASILAEAGELPQTEAALFAIEQASRRATERQLRAQVEEREQELRSVLGLSPSATLDLIPALSIGPAPDAAELPSHDHPTLARLRYQHEVADRDLHLEIKKQYPDITFGPQAEAEEGQSRIGFIGAIPIPILNSNKGGIAEARAAREVALAAFETDYERIVGRLAVLRARHSGILSRRAILMRDLVPLVDRQVTDANRLFELGEGSSVVLFETLLQANEARLRLIDLQLEEALTTSEILFLLGPRTRK
ncbi:MAG: TolC family protein [Verrucomicrobiota bacterium]